MLPSFLSLAVTLLLASNSRAIPPDKNFILQTCSVNNTDPSLNGQYVTTFHTGAGTSAATITPNSTFAPPFNATTYPSNSTDTYIQIAGLTYPYTLGLYNYPPYDASSPASYLYVDVDIGYETPGLYLDDGDIVRYSGNLSFGTFAVCEVNGIAPYFSLGPEKQLLWQDEVAVMLGFSGVGCSDVELKAVVA